MGKLLAARDAQLAETKKGKREIKAACKRKMKLLLVVGILVDFGILVALKYLGFFGEVASSALGLFGIDATFRAPRIGITIGISFYTLMAVSYLLDVYRETEKADRNLGRVALFLSFFPQIMEGPICRYGQTAMALTAGNNLTRANLHYGLLRIAVGLAKKLVVADRLDLFVKPVFENYAQYDGGVIALGAVLYTLQLYCDFSGCMDVAIGSARLFGVEFPENFRQPFFSKTASEFWQRWHITLGTWFKDYIYYPISLSKPVKSLTSKARKRFGNRYGPLLTSSIALFCVWLGNGLWHGAGSQYVAFGMYYFVLIMAGGFMEPAVQAFAERHGINRESAPYQAFRIARTCIVIFAGELVFRSTSFADSLAMFGQIFSQFTLATIGSDALFAIGMDGDDFALVALCTALIIAADVARERGHGFIDFVIDKGPVALWTTIFALAMSVVVFGAYGFGYAPVDPLYAHF